MVSFEICFIDLVLLILSLPLEKLFVYKNCFVGEVPNGLCRYEDLRIWANCEDNDDKLQCECCNCLGTS